MGIATLYGSVDCPLIPEPRTVPGECGACPAKLPSRRRRWCSDRCATKLYAEVARNHEWGAASAAAKARDGHKCVRCGSDGRPPKAEHDALRASQPKPPPHPEGATPIGSMRSRTAAEREVLQAYMRSQEFVAYREALDDYHKATDNLFHRYRLEVNHIVPREGQGYKPGCHHHLDNLETLCHPCHVKVTNEQREARMRREYRRQQALFASDPPATMDDIHGWLEEGLEKLVGGTQ